MKVRRRVGIAHTRRRRDRPSIGRPLALDRTGDRAELEANRVANLVARTPAGNAPPLQCLSISTLGRGEEETLQARARDGRGPTTPPGFGAQLHALRGCGRPLSAAERDALKPGFGTDFSRVRIHQGGQAGKLADSVRARAFTAGWDIVMGEGQYRPGSRAGCRLLAHELTHVVQQDGGDQAAVQRQEKDQPTPAPAQPAAPARPAAPVFHVCDPPRKLTWADFQKQPPRGRFGAFTKVHFPKSTSGGTTRFKAKFQPTKSWAIAAVKNPTSKSATGCQKYIDQCKKYVKNNPGGSWSFNGKPSKNCPASPTKDPTISTSTEAECETDIGGECIRVAKLESARVLRHEQLHMDISCEMAKKANQALSKGAAVKKVKKALNKKARKLDKKYDKETHHGCKAAEQKTWETEVAAGLPKETVP